MKDKKVQRLPKILLGVILLLLLIAVFSSYSIIHLHSKIEQSTHASVLITTYSTSGSSETVSFLLWPDDPRYIELSHRLTSVSYRKRILQNQTSHDLKSPSPLVCIDIRYFSEEDVQVFLELWSDGGLSIDQQASDLLFSQTDFQAFFQEIHSILTE